MFVFLLFFSLAVHKYLTTSCVGSRQGSYFQLNNQQWA